MCQQLEFFYFYFYKSSPVLESTAAVKCVWSRMMQLSNFLINRKLCFDASLFYVLLLSTVLQNMNSCVKASTVVASNRAQQVP